jgi:hypothetical protein
MTVILVIYAITFVVAFLSVRAINIQNQTHINMTDLFLVLIPGVNILATFIALSGLNREKHILDKVFLINWDKHK